MPKKNDITKDQLVSSLVTNYGVVARTATMLNISVGFIYELIKRYELKDTLEEIRDNIDDLAYDSIVDGISDPKIALGLLNLRHKGRNDGLRITGDNIKIVVGNSNDEDDLDKFINE